MTLKIRPAAFAMPVARRVHRPVEMSIQATCRAHTESRPPITGARDEISRAAVSQVLAGEPGQGEVGDFAPAVVEDERVAAVGECVIIGDRA